MAKFIEVPESETVTQLQFFCPGCKERHSLNDTWTYNGDPDNPTVSPSILVTGWAGGPNGRCHSFIKEGKIQFLGDCTHDLKNQTVDLPEIDA